MNKLDIDTLSYDELLKKYKELKEKMDHTKAVVPNKKVSAGAKAATSIALFLIFNTWIYMAVSMQYTFGWMGVETVIVVGSILNYYMLSEPERANKRARKVLVQVCGGNEDSLSDFGIEALQRGKYLSDSAINTYWFVREHWLYENKDGSRNKKVLNNQYILPVWWLVVSINGKIYAINTQRKERIDWIIEKLTHAGYKVTKNIESDDNEED